MLTLLQSLALGAGLGVVAVVFLVAVFTARDFRQRVKPDADLTVAIVEYTSWARQYIDWKAVAKGIVATGVVGALLVALLNLAAIGLTHVEVV